MQSNSYIKAFYHLVWTTKERKLLITEEFKIELYKYLGHLITKNGWHLLAIGGVSDHIHILLQKFAKYDLTQVVRYLKSNSSRFIRTNFNSEFNWQESYSAFTVDVPSLARIKKYILDQEKHHKDMCVQQESDLLEKRFNIYYAKALGYKQKALLKSKRC